MRTRETAENAQRAVLQRLISSVVGAWSTAHGPALRSLLAALDDPSLTQLLGACAEVSIRLPLSSNAAAMRRAYLLAIKRVHPDKLGADSTLTERLTAGAIFDVLREAHERGVVAAAHLQRQSKGRRRRPRRRLRVQRGSGVQRRRRPRIMAGRRHGAWASEQAYSDHV